MISGELRRNGKGYIWWELWLRLASGLEVLRRCNRRSHVPASASPTLPGTHWASYFVYSTVLNYHFLHTFRQVFTCELQSFLPTLHIPRMSLSLSGMLSSMAWSLGWQTLQYWQLLYLTKVSNPGILYSFNAELCVSVKYVPVYSPRTVLEHPQEC